MRTSRFDEPRSGEERRLCRRPRSGEERSDE